MTSHSPRSGPTRSTPRAGNRPHWPVASRAGGWPPRSPISSAPELAFLRWLFEFVENGGGQLATEVDDLGCALEFQAAAGAARHLDQHVGGVGGQNVAGQRRLSDVDRAVHHL